MSVDDKELRDRLTDEQYQVTQQKGTERPFTGRFVDHKADGTYACCTQNLNPCGGLRGKLCKHLLVLIIGMTRGGEIAWEAPVDQPPRG